MTIAVAMVLGVLAATPAFADDPQCAGVLGQTAPPGLIVARTTYQHTLADAYNRAVYGPRGVTILRSTLGVVLSLGTMPGRFDMCWAIGIAYAPTGELVPARLVYEANVSPSNLTELDLVATFVE